METRKTILLLTDFTKRATRAADFALQLAITNEADLVIYNSVIVVESDILIGKKKSAADEIATKTDKSTKNLHQLTEYLQSALAAKQIAGLKITTKDGMGGVVPTILNLVTEYNVWMVVMGNHVEKDIATLYFDSNIPNVMSSCGCPLLLVP